MIWGLRRVGQQRLTDNWDDSAEFGISTLSFWMDCKWKYQQAKIFCGAILGHLGIFLLLALAYDTAANYHSKVNLQDVQLQTYIQM